MASRKIDVLVYSGPGSSVNTVYQCLYSLRRLISPNYAVIPVTDQVILKEPWSSSCALLVFPGGADTGYCRSLNGEGNRIIDQFIRRGGAFLGLCAGGYYGSSRCEFEVGNKSFEVVGPRELSFFPGTCRGCVFKGFEYESEAGARATELTIFKHLFHSTLTPQKFRCYYNGGGVFVDAAKFAHKGVEILANYSENFDIDGSCGSAAVVYCKISEGRVILTGVHPEFAAANLDLKAKNPEYLEMVRALTEDDNPRENFLRACLRKLGLTVSQKSSSLPSPSQLYLSSFEPHLVSKLVSSWKPIITIHDGVEYVNGGTDTFCLAREGVSCQTELAIGNTSLSEIKILNDRRMLYQLASMGLDKGADDFNSTGKQIIAHESNWPDAKETPYFNHHAYYECLLAYQNEEDSDTNYFGKYLLYGEAVTSTNTMLEKNLKWLTRMPTGFTFTATTQVAGRGRGSNIWLSPSGSLVTSLYIKHSISLSTKAPIVFIQYIAAIAIVEGIQSYSKGFETIPVKIKWPNDIYIKDPSKEDKDEKSYVKLGGILVNSSYSNEAYNLVLGIGLNAMNMEPTTSLQALVPPDADPLTIEKLLARILTSFERIYKKFCFSGFDKSFQAIYCSHWLHTNQIVTLEAEGGIRARIKGITTNHGLLRVEELGLDDQPTGKIWELQSDYNSFDFFKGLLKVKL